MPKPPTRYKKNGSPMKKKAKRITKKGEYRNGIGKLIKKGKKK
tara:strand:+ start:288 stop:416 length:129 start_codon:yes stop_codon:yes gene_type:complete